MRIFALSLATQPAPVCAVKVSFSSYAMGIDSAALDCIKRVLDEDPRCRSGER